ncbi:phytoene desaturase family protein [Amycolatopsis rubida]|uniref:Phytoene dehydrogenase-related protein n=1 Tax=Amycolatopsis rubida TaxID=112413 RepID=A0A1I5WP95_9PSEU|nr:NAD(P)/FAD-dependent oxidoreductase [Amycolatopsis rubida]SFQ21328.1 Phytoene dehydrogenase-related protein [Amycolatopsis rubida]
MSPPVTLDVAVVGSGPNGLAAAVLLARAGLSVEVYEAADGPGGGARSKRLFDSDVIHDICSAVHPMAAASPFLRQFDLDLCHPEIPYAHPIDEKTTAIAYADLDRTCARLGTEGARWRRFMAPLIEHSAEITEVLLGDLRRPPHPRTAAYIATRALMANSFKSKEAAALIAGVEAHALGKLPSLIGGGIAVLLAHLAHTTGWPIPRGGSQRITDALVADIEAHGGRVRANARVTDVRELAHARAVLLDLAPKGVLDIAGSLLPQQYRRALENVRYGPAAAKVDFLVSEAIPWREKELARAGTVHIGGTKAEVHAAENAVAAGKRARDPFVLLSQPMIADSSRGRPGKQPIWAYAHVPHGDPLDPTAAIIRRVERFAPGFRDTILASRAIPASDFEAYNANYVGGDIAAAAVTLRQVLGRPVLRWDPYRTPLRGVYLCSAATPPGPGVHGMAGQHAAERVLRNEFGYRPGRTKPVS